MYIKCLISCALSAADKLSSSSTLGRKMTLTSFPRRFSGSCSLSVKRIKINLCLSRLVDEIFHPHMHAHSGDIASIPRLQITCVNLAKLFRMRIEEL